MSVNIVITTAGRAALVNAQNTGTAPVAITQVGISQMAVVAAVGAVALAGELKRVSGVAGEVVANDTIHINMTDDSGDAYSMRSFALYLADGTLFGIYGQADPLIIKTAGSIAALAIDTIFADIDAALLTFGNANFTNPPATTERQGVIELATTAEAQAGIDALRALTPASAKAAILGWLLSQDGSGSGLDADLLDGQHGGYYADIAARLGYVPLNKAGDTVNGYLRVAGPLSAYLAGGITGIVYLNNDGTRYLHSDGSSYSLVGQPLYVNGSLVWTVGNDGAGSGLDADLLDGLDSSAFARLTGAAFTGDVGVARAGSPSLILNSTGAVIARLAAQNDGNLVFYRNAGAGDVPVWAVNSQIGPLNVSMPLRVRGGGNGFVELQTSGNGDSGRIDFLGNDGARKGYIYAPTNATMAYGNDSASGHHFWGGQLRRDGALVWDAANDGHGSGLDADLLDGRHASDFMLASDGSKFGSNGDGYWETRANGFLEQWGTVSQAMTQGWYGHNWPQWFNDPASVNLQITPFNPSGTTGQQGDWWPQVKEVTQTGFTMVMQDSSNSSSGAGYHWRAIGR